MLINHKKLFNLKININNFMYESISISIIFYLLNKFVIIMTNSSLDIQKIVILFDLQLQL